MNNKLYAKVVFELLVLYNIQIMSEYRTFIYQTLHT
jgi:hypothetical protein